MQSRGRFITLEGGEGAGKSTLMKKLSEEIPHSFTAFEPGDTPLGQGIRHLLLDATHPVSPRAELLLYLADRAQHVNDVILPALERGLTVICDRYNDSSVAYQGAARNLPIGDLCDFATNGLTPDITFYLDLDPKIGLSRTTTLDRLEKESLEFHAKVREGFLHLAKTFPDRIKTIDASKPIEDVIAEAISYL